MNLLLPLLMIAAMPDASAESRHPDAIEVYRCTFSPETDANFDQWPDGWTRRHGHGYPKYLKIGISEEESPVGDRCLRANLDGGAATIYSPPIPVSFRFSFVLEAYMKTEKLVHDEAFVSVTFYDDQRTPLETYYSKRFEKIDQWTKVYVGPVTPTHEDISQAVIGLHIRPREKTQADLVGSAVFDDIWLARMPRMTLHSNSQHNVYPDPKLVSITCRVSGILERDPMMTFELVDVSSRRLAQMKDRLDGEVVAQKVSRFTKLLKQQGVVKDADAQGFAGVMSWKPPITEYGYYRVRVTMTGTAGLMQRRDISVAVIRPHPTLSHGEFGWSLPRGDKPLDLGALVGLLDQVGINWVKFPVWYSEKDADRADRLAWFAERLSRQNIELVGLLDQPPPEVRHLFGAEERLLAAGVFADPGLWHPVLNPVMTRLSLKVRWWQLGSDDDTSFVGFRNLPEKIGEVKKQLERFGQEINLGIGWRWMNEMPEVSRPPWNFLSLTAEPSLTQTEMSTYLAKTEVKNAQRWAVLQPLSSEHYTVQTRARDLVGRMLAAKRGNVDCVYIPDPFDPRHGLMHEDGTPGELLLPFRTTALMISGTRYVGGIRLPQGSHNYVYARGSDAIMVVWNEKPVKEVIYLGENVEQIDLWGRVTIPELQEHRQVIEVGPLPTFITGVHPLITQWRMATEFDRKELASVFGKQQSVSFRMKNFFERGIGGKVTLVTPKVWETTPEEIHFKLAVGEEVSQPFQVRLRPDASSGKQAVRIDYDVTADESYKFSVHRTMAVGLGDVVVDVDSQINDKGDLVVKMHLTNKTDKFVSFNCLLFAPGRRRMRQQVFNLGRGRSSKIFTLPRGAELAGKTLWLRAEELGGERVLSHRFAVESTDQ